MADVIHVITDMGVGGAGVLLSHLLHQNAEGSLAVLPEGSLLSSLFEKNGLPYKTFPQKRECSLSPLGVWHLRKIFRAESPRLIVSHASLSAKIAAKSLSIPTLSVRHCDTPINPHGVWLYNLLTDGTVATSLPLAEHLARAGVKRIYTVENGYTDMKLPSPQARRRARMCFSIPDGCIAVGLVGRLSPVKGQETAIRALQRLGGQGEKIILCFLGDGEEKARLCALSGSLGLSERVRFFGFSPDVKQFYHAIDVHLSTSFGSETSSLTLAEGMSAGCPTVASDTEGNRARLAHGGRLFPRGDIEALSNVLLSLLDEKERKKLSQMALKRARTLPTWEEMGAKYRRIFDAF